MMKKTLTLLALSAVLASPVSTIARAEGMDGHGPMPMLNFDAIDTDKDGKITSVEFDAFRAAEFSKADANADGQVSAEELAAKQVADMTARAADMATKMIERMDDDGDGLLSAEEMAQGPRAPTMFERADADGDGAISKEEVEAMKGKMGHRHGKHGQRG
jgi:Ca2+-binding EF-hand superfamily protein